MQNSSKVVVKEKVVQKVVASSDFPFVHSCMQSLIQASSQWGDGIMYAQ
jgi:hypothetical protein